MADGILGRKLGMTQIYLEDGTAVPVTVVQAGPCPVVQVKTAEKDGYEALQIGFDEIRKAKGVTRPAKGHFDRAGVSPRRHLREIGGSGESVGDEITVDIFEPGETVSVVGRSKGKGFQGVMRRHNFGGGPGGHGSMFNRAPGSVGASSYPSRVFKGSRGPGHMGSVRVTTQGLQIVEVKKEQNILLIKGSVPGSRGSVVLVRKV